MMASPRSLDDRSRGRELLEVASAAPGSRVVEWFRRGFRGLRQRSRRRRSAEDSTGSFGPARRFWNTPGGYRRTGPSAGPWILPWSRAPCLGMAGPEAFLLDVCRCACHGPWREPGGSSCPPGSSPCRWACRGRYTGENEDALHIAPAGRGSRRRHGVLRDAGVQLIEAAPLAFDTPPNAAVSSAGRRRASR